MLALGEANVVTVCLEKPHPMSQQSRCTQPQCLIPLQVIEKKSHHSVISSSLDFGLIAVTERSYHNALHFQAFPESPSSSPVGETLDPPLTLMGFVLSLYAFIVELNISSNHEYRAMCDFSEHMSCSKAFSSQWGTGFGFVGKLLGEDSAFNQPNSVPGMLFYVIFFILSFRDSAGFARALVFQSVLANLMSVYLAYILYFVLRDFCIVCISTYVTNATLFYMSYGKYKLLRYTPVDSRKKSK